MDIEKLTIDKLPPEKEQKHKRLFVWIVLIYSFVWGIASVIEEPQSKLVEFIDYVYPFLLIAAAWSWVNTDLYAKGKLFSSSSFGWGMGMLLFSPVALPAYYYSTRGFKGGSILVFKTLGVLVLSVAIAATGGAIYSAIWLDWVISGFHIPDHTGDYA